MQNRVRNRYCPRPVDIAACSALLLTASAAVAANQPDVPDQGAPSSTLTTVVVSGQEIQQQSATTQAPTLTPLDVSQPTSAISQYFIQNNMPTTSNYSDIIAISPSVQSVQPNGPGLMENQSLSIRGFQDGFFNVTFDGIPWNDANDFTHHSTSYFMDNDLGGVSVDRGPGTAATIGNATFGGTITNVSKAPLADETLTPSVTYGSFGTSVIGAEFDTGTISKWGGAAGYIDAESLSSDGELSNSGLDRKNIFSKLEVPVDDFGTLTFVAMYNQIHQDVGVGATAAQIAQYGPTYMLSSDPGSQDYYGYNFDSIHTDFEYVGFKGNLGDDWTVDNKVYTYGYWHRGHAGEDPNGPTPNGTPFGANDVPGSLLTNDYRSWGDTLNLQDTFSFGDLKTGMWVDRQFNVRGLANTDETLNDAFVESVPGSVVSAYYGGRLLNQELTTLQGYVQFDWIPVSNLTLSPGVRYVSFERDVNAVVNVKTGNPQSYDNTFDSTLPSLLAHYMITGNWSAYAQVAKGFLAPNENYFNFEAPGSTSLAPQQTWNYQVGTSWQTSRMALSADAYYINFNNEISSETVGTETVFYNLGGTTYKGVEAEGTYYVGSGFSVYANGSVNSAKDKTTGDWVPFAPNFTASLGAIYNLGGWYGSLIDKWVGRTYDGGDQTIPIGSYAILNGALGYKFVNAQGWLRNASIKLDFDNLLNNTNIDMSSGTTAGSTVQYPGGVPLYWTIPGRSVFATVSLPIS
ncbi:MAG TPA: TonB-dependent receptor [Steroidobacteraceae bacterium]|nr:TonB-dependent receptor [Steroidobacteraceae bacterium]